MAVPTIIIVRQLRLITFVLRIVVRPDDEDLDFLVLIVSVASLAVALVAPSSPASVFAFVVVTMALLLVAVK